MNQQYHFNCGQISQALVSSIKLTLKQYLMLIAQLEILNKQGELTLSKLWF